MHEVVANGFLFIGDPHISSRKPGTRNDVDFVATVAGKLEQVAEIANTNGLQAVFLGDMFNRAQEPDARLLVLLTRALKRFQLKPWTLMGNHDINETTLTENTSLALMREAELLHVVDTAGPFMVLNKPDGSCIGLGGSPYGMVIPDDIEQDLALFGKPVDRCIWITHHDLAFEGAYPGALEMYPITGCDLVVNGHMHLTKAPRLLGNTTWFNPGNITRQSKDTANHVPAVWEVSDVATLLPKQHVLSYDPAVFDEALQVVQGVRPELTQTASAFVQQLRAFGSGDVARTEDGSELAKDIAAVLESQRVPAEVASLIVMLHSKAVDARSV